MCNVLSFFIIKYDKQNVHFRVFRPLNFCSPSHPVWLQLRLINLLTSHTFTIVISGDICDNYERCDKIFGTYRCESNINAYNVYINFTVCSFSWCRTLVLLKTIRI